VAATPELSTGLTIDGRLVHLTDQGSAGTMLHDQPGGFMATLDSDGTWRPSGTGEIHRWPTPAAAVEFAALKADLPLGCKIEPREGGRWFVVSRRANGISEYLRDNVWTFTECPYPTALEAYLAIQEAAGREKVTQDKPPAVSNHPERLVRVPLAGPNSETMIPTSQVQQDEGGERRNRVHADAGGLKCARCHGDGEVQSQYEEGSYARSLEPCPACYGTGEVQLAPQQGRMNAKRPLTDLSFAELRRALQATIAAAGPDSSSATAIREAIAAKRAASRQAKPTPQPADEVERLTDESILNELDETAGVWPSAVRLLLAERRELKSCIAALASQPGDGAGESKPLFTPLGQIINSNLLVLECNGCSNQTRVIWEEYMAGKYDHRFFKPLPQPPGGEA
jgi:hypothetical protein